MGVLIVMKKILTLMVMLMVTAIFLSSCGGNSQGSQLPAGPASGVPASEGLASEGLASDGPTSEGPASAGPASEGPASEGPISQERPIVYASFHAMYDFTKTIAGEAIQVELLLPAGASAHHWEPSARDMARLSDADAFIFHGAGMEHFTDALQGSLGNQLIFVEASAAVEPGLAGADPHLWLNPLYALRMKETIKEALIDIYEDGAYVFRENFNEASYRLMELDAAFRQAADDFVRRDIVVSHGAFGHLSHAYGLNQVTIEGLQVRIDPSPARMVDVIGFVRENGVTTIFYDKDPAIAQTVADATGVSVVMLDTFEGVTYDDYFTVMWRNLGVLVEALGAEQ